MKLVLEGLLLNKWIKLLEDLKDYLEPEEAGDDVIDSIEDELVEIVRQYIQELLDSLDNKEIKPELKDLYDGTEFGIHFEIEDWDEKAFRDFFDNIIVLIKKHKDEILRNLWDAELKFYKFPSLYQALEDYENQLEDSIKKAKQVKEQYGVDVLKLYNDGRSKLSTNEIAELVEEGMWKHGDLKENVNFTRGTDPKKTMEVGRYAQPGYDQRMFYAQNYVTRILGRKYLEGKVKQRQDIIDKKTKYELNTDIQNQFDYALGLIEKRFEKFIEQHYDIHLN